MPFAARNSDFCLTICGRPKCRPYPAQMRPVYRFSFLDPRLTLSALTRGLPLHAGQFINFRMADQTIRVEYNEELKPLEQLLSGVERAGDFFATGALELPMPRVDVEGAGVLSFPVPPSQIAVLLGQATRAPYGRGEATILDEAVRKVWQVPSDKVQIGGKSWAANFDGILRQVVAGLGCEGMAVSAQLYKLLVYDQGDFFLAHRDTEKSDGMFATLVITLPSAHRGGELVIRHAGREVVVDASGMEVSEVRFVAFYADCEHEVRPITEGNRVSLVYNLIQERGAKGKGQPVQAPHYEREIAEAAQFLEAKLSEPDAVAKIAWLLEHQYSPDGLEFGALKSADAARVKVLAEAADRAGCAAHLGIVHIEESGPAEPKYFRPRSRRWYRDDVGRESADSGGQDFEVVEVSDSRHYVNQWRDSHDNPVEFGDVPLADGELLPTGALDNEKPDHQRLTEASGNEGASFERSYHRAALVIWRRERYAEVLLQAGVGAVLPYLKERIEAAGSNGAPSTARQEAVILADRVVNAWAAAPSFFMRLGSGTPETRDGMLRLLNKLGDTALLEEFIAAVVTRDYDGSDNGALVAGARLLDAKATARLFSDLFRHHMRHLHGHCVDLLVALVSKGDDGSEQESREALRQIAKAAVSKLDEIGKQGPNEWVDWRVSQKARALDAALVVKLLDVLGDLDAPALRAAAVKEFASRPAVFDPVAILVPAISVIRHRDAAVERLWEHSAEFLLLRRGRPPVAPADWRQDIKLSCSCADCRELQAFAHDPVERTHRFRVRQDRRQHLDGQIVQHDLDMTQVTDCKGSPQTLVCTKDRRSYQRRCEQYRKDIAALAALAEQARKISATNGETLKRIEAARSLAAKWSPT